MEGEDIRGEGEERSGEEGRGKGGGGERRRRGGCTIFPFCRSAPPLRFVLPADARSAPAPLSTSGAGPACP